ncbi:hypothetical protein [Sediminibacillus massiliensis]|uniref:hypothetical protein n=1 Tax=Sediminibacillus massiliensis TaxID=1926277 RepID=UPI0009883D2E|nr:hypothetical protein [Sediminibacillus massiliensis]
MREWLTTGEMIDRLKVGERAELESAKCIPSNYGPSYKHVIKKEDGDIRWCKNDGSLPSPSPLQIFGHVLTWKWRILPNYVSFEEAVRALKDGKRVALWNERTNEFLTSFNKSISIQFLEGTGLSFDKWINGKWTIEEADNELG